MRSRIDTPDDARLAPYRFAADPHALDRAGFFIVEGRLAAPQLLASSYRVHSLLVSEAALESLEPALAARPDVDVLVAPVPVFRDIGSVNFHRGCLALGYRGAATPLEALLAADPDRSRPLIVLESVSNPDNIGGIFRSARAFSARGIVLGPGCGDPLYRKAIRTSMGAVLQMAWAVSGGWPAALAAIRERGYRVVALTTARTAAPIREVLRASAPCALLLGSEGFGLSAEAQAAADVAARIPMPNADADSLNVTAAATVAMYEARQAEA